MKTRKRALSILLCVVMLLALMPSALAAESMPQSRNVIATGYCGDAAHDAQNLTWVLTSDGTLTISGEGNMGTLNMGDFEDSVTAVEIKSGVTNVVNFAFSGCANLLTATISETVNQMGWCAFSSCYQLSEVHFKGDLPNIDESAFRDVTAAVYYPAGNSSYDGAGQYGGKLYWFPEGTNPVVESGTYTNGLKWSLLGNGLLTISGNGAIQDSDSEGDGRPWNQYQYQIRSVVIEQGVTGIGDYAFAGCSLQSIQIPSSVTYIGNMAFLECRKLAAVSIPENVTRIGDRAFEECGIRSVDLPASLTNIGSAAFKGCGLESISIPDGIQEIASETFSHCFVLRTVELPQSVTKIGDDAFYYCWRMTSFNTPGKLTYIGSHAFFHCSGLELLDIPETVTYIGESAFSDCSGLRTIVIPDGITEINNYLFMGAENLTSVTIPDSVTRIGSSAFYDCKSLASIILPASVNKIEVQAFMNCEGLPSIDIPEGVDRILGCTFQGCSQLKSISIPLSVTYISHAFGYCFDLTDVYYAGSAEDWEKKIQPNLLTGDYADGPLMQATLHYNSQKSGWEKTSEGWCYYENNTPVTGWKTIDGARYYFNTSGIMQTGWVKDGINWYYMNGSGVMKTGWQKLADGNWYYFYEDGHMACNETVNIGGSNYTFNGSGIWVQKKNGWEQKDGAWYYYANGEKATGWKQLSDGNWYYFNSDGKMQTGWLKLGKYWYYLNGSGIMVTGWQKLADGNWYYFYPGGTMACNETVNIGGVDYTFNSSGIWVH